MTNYEMLQSLLNDEDLLHLLADHLACDKVKTTLSELDNDRYLLDVDHIDVIFDTDVTMYTLSFDFSLNGFGELSSFYVKCVEQTTVNDAFEYARIGRKIEDYLRSKLN